MFDEYKEEIDTYSPNEQQEQNEQQVSEQIKSEEKVQKTQQAHQDDEKVANKTLENKPSEPDGKYLSEEEYENFLRMQQDMELKKIENDFKAKYPDFNMQKVTDKILEIEEKEPGKGQTYLNDIGFENIYLKYFHGKDSLDDFDIARGGGNGGININESIEKINSQTATLDEKTALYSRFL